MIPRGEIENKSFQPTALGNIKLGFGSTGIDPLRKGTIFCFLSVNNQIQKPRIRTMASKHLQRCVVTSLGIWSIAHLDLRALSHQVSSFSSQSLILMAIGLGAIICCSFDNEPNLERWHVKRQKLLKLLMTNIKY